MTGRRLITAIFVVLAVIVVVGALLVWKPQIDPIEPAKTSAFNSVLVTDGAELAALGNCAVCHTAPGGKAYAGSRELPTPFGMIYSSNITPDAETGLAVGRRKHSAARCATASTVKGAIFIRHFLTITSRISPTMTSARSMPSS